MCQSAQELMPRSRMDVLRRSLHLDMFPFVLSGREKSVIQFILECSHGVIQDPSLTLDA